MKRHKISIGFLLRRQDASKPKKREIERNHRKGDVVGGFRKSLKASGTEPKSEDKGKSIPLG